jgi:senataxin
LAGAGGADLRKTCCVDDLIVDEAAAATEPLLCVPFHLRPKRLLAVGDPKQLGATIQSRNAADRQLDKSMHQRLMDECGYKPIMLNVQYRMNPEIAQFPSTEFYQSQLLDGPNVNGPLYQNGAKLLNRLPYSFVQVDGMEENSRGFCNRREAEKVADLIVELRDLSVRESPPYSCWHGSDRIRVITFYQAQVSLIKECLRTRGLDSKIAVATVDSSQGSEADVVILSFVRTPQRGYSNVGFLDNDRRLNVGLTRAKYQLICVANVERFETIAGNGAATLRKLAVDARRRGLVIQEGHSTGTLVHSPEETQPPTKRSRTSW